MASRMKDGDQRKGDDSATQTVAAQKGRQSEFAVSPGGINQESRQHNKPRLD